MNKINYLKTGLLLIALILGMGNISQADEPVTSDKNVYVLYVTGTIEPGLVPYTRRALKEAHTNGADALIVEIETFGGRVDVMTELSDVLMESEIETTIAFINHRAISAGALIALSCKHIVMAPKGTIGAATPVYPGEGGKMVEAGQKVVSFAREEFYAAAEENGHPTDIATAFVDKEVKVVRVTAEGDTIVVSEKGSVLTLSTSKAIQWGLAEYEAKDVEQVLDLYGLTGATIHYIKPNWAENLARFLTSGVIASLLLTAGILAIYTEVRTPGFGLPGFIGTVCLMLFFGGQYIVGLAGIEDLILFALGVILIAVEIFILPGFGIAGVLGITALIGSFIMAMVKYKPSVPIDVYIPSLVNAGTVVTVSLFSSVILGAVMMRFLPKSHMFSRLILADSTSDETGFQAPPPNLKTYLGKIGVTTTSLRPSGTILIEDSPVDVVTEGDFIEPGRRVQVVQVEGTRVVVRAV